MIVDGGESKSNLVDYESIFVSTTEIMYFHLRFEYNE